MLSLDATQQAVVASARKPEISWLFEIDTDNDGTPDYRYSTKAKSFGGDSFTFKVLKFTPIGIQRSSSEYGLVVPNKFTFTIDNSDDALTPSNFNGAAVKVKLVIDDGTNGDTEIASWEFEVINYGGPYKEITLVCRDWLQKYLDGDYPNEPLIKDIFPSDDPTKDKDDNICSPILYGTGYFPIRSVYIADQRYYVLGKIDTTDSPTFSITKIRSPRELNAKSEWSSGSYTFNQYEFRAFEELGPDLMSNGGFETAGGGGADVFANWTETASDGSIDDEASLYKKGAHACKLTAGASVNTRIGNTDAGDRLTVTASTNYKLSVWTRGDGTYSGFYQIYDHSNGANIVAKTTLGVTGSTYTLKEIYFTTPVGCTSISISFWCPSTNGGICYVDDVQVRTCDRRRTDGDLYKVVQFLISDADLDGSADANGLFVSGENFLDVPCKYSKSDTSSTTNPADIIEAILLDFGIPSAKIDSTTQASVAATFTGWSFTWNMGLWYKMPRKKLLAKLLAMCHIELIVRDKIYFKVHSKTSKGTIDSSYILRKKERGKGTFSIKNLTAKNLSKDSGYGAFQQSDEPIDKLQKFLVPAKSTTNDISNDTIECDYIQDSQHAQKIAQLGLQRRLLAFQSISFQSKGTALAYEVDDVITIANDANYGAEGATYDVLIDKMVINKDVSIKFECTRFSDSLNDWGDLSPNAITIASDNSTSLYSPVICGPDAPGLTGSQVTNALPGRLRVGNDANYIVIEPDRSSDRYIATGKTDFTTTGNGFIIGIDHSDSDKVKLYLGNTTDYMYWDGSNLVISGNITATTGSIGGWTITSTTLHSNSNIVLDSGNKGIYINDTTYGNEGIQLEYNSGYPRVYVGDGGNNYFKYDGTKIQWKGANTELDGSGNFTCTGGTIGGWTIGATTISSANITIDSGNERIRSANYVAGFAGAGFTLEPGLLEVGNIACRGIIRTAVFQKDIISAVGGNLLVSKGSDVLDADMTAADSSNLTIEGNENFSVGDILRIKDGTDDEWLEITDNTYDPIYTVSRDLAGSYGADSNPVWKKGATVVNYGASGDGLIHMTASETNAPFISVLTHAGAPYTAITTRLRIGNLNGFLGYSSDKYGIAIGETNKYLKYDPTGGLVIQGTVNIIGSATLGDGSNYSGTITLSIADGQGDCYIAAGKSDFANTDNGFILGVDDSDSNKVKFYLGNATNYFNWDGTNIKINVDGAAALEIKSGGDITLETDASSPAMIKFVGSSYTTSISSWSADGSQLSIKPETDDVCAIYIGEPSYRWSPVNIIGDIIRVQAYTDGDNNAELKCTTNGTTSQYIEMILELSATTKTLKALYQSGVLSFYPLDSEEWDLGNSTYYWKDIYARNLYLKDSDAHPIIQISAAHATDYDPQIKFATDATPTVKFSLGVDGNDDMFKIYSGDGVGDTTEFVINTSGIVFIGDNANSKMTTPGLTINQGSGAVEILAFKSSDISHPMTASAEADTYGLFKKVADATGGCKLEGFREGDGPGINLWGCIGTTTPDETAATSSNAAVEVNGYYSDGGTGRSAMSGDDNVFIVAAGGNARFIIKANGDYYYDGSGSAYDEYEDALACGDLSHNLSGQLDKVLKYNKKKLSEMGVISHTICKDGEEDIFVSGKGMTMLQLGAIGELYRVCNHLCLKLGITYKEARKELR